MISQYSASNSFTSSLSDKFISLNLFFSLLINISLWLLLAYQTRNFTDTISLHYNIYFGIDLLGSRYKVFLLPALGLVFLAINSLVGLLVYKREKILSYFLFGTSSFVQVIFIIASIFIILINQ